MVSSTYRRGQKVKKTKQEQKGFVRKVPVAQRNMCLRDMLKEALRRRDRKLYEELSEKYEMRWIIVRVCADRATEIVKRDAGPFKDRNAESRKDFDYYVEQSTRMGKNDYYTHGGAMMDMMADLLDHFREYINLNLVRYRIAVMDLFRDLVPDNDLVPAYASLYVASKLLQLGNEFHHDMEGRGHTQVYNMVQACANMCQSLYPVPSYAEVDDVKYERTTKEELAFGKKLGEWLAREDGMTEAIMQYAKEHEDDEYVKKALERAAAKDTSKQE